MRIRVIAVGRARRGAARDLYEDYAGRLAGEITLKEIDVRRPLAPPILKTREGELLLDAVPKGATAVALDAGGKALSSNALSERLENWRDNGVADLAFLIGGAEGLDQKVLDRADFVLSLGPMTWPHMLVRAMLAEQLYRAQSILSGHPYHRG